MPASRAAWTVAMLSRRSARPYVPDMPMQPSPTRAVGGPCCPSVVLMTCTIASRRSAEGVADSGDETTDMNQHEVSRTLVKSQPELWAELSDPSSLARHLDQFGEIRITRLEPETTVAWEGQRVSGTVRLEPSG